MMDANEQPYAVRPDLLATVSWFHADGNYYRTREFYTRTKPLTHHSTHTSIVQKTDDDYANCVEFVKANDYYMTGHPEMIMCPYCNGAGNHGEGAGGGPIVCSKCNGEGIVEED